MLNKLICFLVILFLSMFIISNPNVANAGISPTLFGLAGCGPDTESTLYTINTNTGVATAVGTGVGFERCGGMDVDDSGTLFAVCERLAANDEIVLITINTSTGDGSEIGRFCDNNGGVTDLSVRNSDDVLYGAVFDLPLVETCDFVLATFNKGTGAESIIGIFSGFSVNGNRGDAMAFSSIDTLFMADGVSLYTVNQSTAALTVDTALFYPADPLDDGPRTNAMDFDPASGLLFASIVNGGRTQPGPRENFLGIITTSLES